MANKKIGSMTSIANSGTLSAPVYDPGAPTSDVRITVPHTIVLSDGTHSVTNPSTIVAQGGTVSGSNNGVGTISGFGGGGGGGVSTAGLGLYISGATVGNTGTIEQPAAMTTSDNAGVLLNASDLTSAGSNTGRQNAAGVYLHAGNGTLSGTASTYGVAGGSWGIYGGHAVGPGSQYAGGAQIYGVGGYIHGNGTTARGASLGINAGGPNGSVKGAGGSIYIKAGYGSGVGNQGGHISLVPGGYLNGGTYGYVVVDLGKNTPGLAVIHPMRTADPHVLGGLFNTITNAAAPLLQSAG